MSKFVTYPAVTVLDNDHSLLIDDPNAGTNSITAENAGNTLLSKWAGFETFDEAVQNTIEHNQEFIDRDTAIREETAELKKKIVTTFPSKEASGAVATFESEFEDAPLKSCIVRVEPVQEGSGDPSPDNVRPISGWTGCEVNACGINLFDKSNTANMLNGADIFGGAIGSGSRRLVVFIPCKPNRTYTVSRKAVLTNERFAIGYTTDRPVIGVAVKNVIIAPYAQTIGNLMSLSVTTGSDAKYVVVWVYWANTTDALDDLQIELGSTATTYEPYTGQTYPITFPTEAGTVYGGYVDVTGGELVVDRAMVDLGDYKWVAEPDPLPGTARAISVDFNIYVYNQYPICSALKGYMPRSFNQITEGCICFSNAETLPMIRVRSQAFVGLTDAEIKTALSGVQCCLKIKEPIHYPITPTEIRTLLGQNNIWSNTGDTAVEYLMSDVSWYVEKKLRAFQSILAGVEDSSTASKNYSANTYLIFNDDIYRVTKAITAGETIEEGVNVTKTTVAEQLLALAQA